MARTLDIYDLLRDMHNILKSIQRDGLSDFQDNALDAVNSVLYLAEGVFSAEEEG